MLMKILSGACIKDEGEIWIDGKQTEIHSPKDGKRNSVGIVYQEFELAGDLTVAENIFLDRLAGLVGSGRTEIARAIFEADKRTGENSLGKTPRSRAATYSVLLCGPCGRGEREPCLEPFLRNGKDHPGSARRDQSLRADSAGRPKWPIIGTAIQ